MHARTVLRAGGRAILSVALVLTVTELVTTPPANAVDPVVIIQTPPVELGGGGNQVIVTTTDLNVSGNITVDNPGSTLLSQQQCLDLSATAGSYCLGTSDQFVSPNDVSLAPYPIQGVPASPYRLPGSAMDWIVDESTALVAAQHGIQNIRLVQTFFRPEIRGYIVARMQDIVNKKLYGEPMDDREKAAYAELEAIFKDKLVQDSKWALEEYDKWNANPCGYVPPPPPTGSGLPAVPNDAASSTLCTSAGSRFAVWKITNGTPPASVFDTWASYRHPTPGVQHITDGRYQKAIASTYGGAIMLAGYAIAIAAGVGLGAALTTLPPATVSAIASAVALWGQAAAEGSTILTTTLTATTLGLSVASSVVMIVAALLTLAIAIWQMVEDAKPGTDLRERVTNAGKSTDVMGVVAAQADYAGLSYADLEDPAASDELAYVHQPAFVDQLVMLVGDWQLFTQSGQLIPDPTAGYNAEGNTTADDAHFVVDGNVQQDGIIVLAPDGTKNDAGVELSGYRVRISEGVLMVSEHPLLGDFQPYQPRSNLLFVDEFGRTARMAVVSVGQTNGPPVRQFEVVGTDAGGDPTYSVATSWKYQQNPGVIKTATLVEQLPLAPVVNVIPGVEGDLIADHVVNLRANVSTPGQSQPGPQYTWTVERLDDSGNVAQVLPQCPPATSTDCVPAGNLVGFGVRLSTPGDYRARVSYAWTGSDPDVPVSGRVGFTIQRPAAKVTNSFPTADDREPRIDDNRVNTGALSLDLRMMQDTRSDTFDVEVEWADDGLGNEVVKHYTVQCVDTGFDTCDTGPLVAPGPNQAPTNPQWSEAPTFQIPDDQHFLPHVTVTVTNGYGETVTRVFGIQGEHRPTYENTTPYVEMPAGTFSLVNVVQVFPSDLFPPPSTPGIEQLQIQPFMADLVSQLPPGVTPQIQQVNGEWWLQLRGEPTADAIGPWTFYYPFEQNVDVGNARRPAPALTTLEVVSSTAPGYRGIIRGAPQDLSQRSYRTDYPDWTVQAAERRPGDDGAFTDFAGTVMCKLFSAASGTVVFDKPCAANGPFPWPAERVPGMQVASVHLVSGTQPISTDGDYEVSLVGNFLDPTLTVNPVAAGDTTVSFKLRVDDVASFLGVVPPPFSGSDYEVSCSLDGAAYVPCLDSGTYSLPKTPGAHTLDVKVKAPDGATAVRRGTWDGGPFPPPPPPAAKQLSATLTAVPAKADALKATFTIGVGYGGTVAAPYAAKGFTVTCLADGKATSCDSGSLQLLRVPGKHQLSVTVKAPSPDAQSLTKTLAWSVATPKKKLTVAAPATGELGEKIMVKARGLLPRETFVIKLDGKKVAKGEANDRGRVVRKVKLGRSLDAGRVKVVVLGATRKRSGHDVVTVGAGHGSGHTRVADPRVARILV